MAAILLVKMAIGSMCASTQAASREIDANSRFAQIVLCTAHGAAPAPLPISNDPVPPIDPVPLGHCDACALLTVHTFAAISASGFERLAPVTMIAMGPQVTASPAVLLRNGGRQSRAPPVVAAI